MSVIESLSSSVVVSPLTSQRLMSHHHSSRIMATSVANTGGESSGGPYPGRSSAAGTCVPCLPIFSPVCVPSSGAQQLHAPLLRPPSGLSLPTPQPVVGTPLTSSCHQNCSSPIPLHSSVNASNINSSNNNSSNIHNNNNSSSNIQNNNNNNHDKPLYWGLHPTLPLQSPPNNNSSNNNSNNDANNNCKLIDYRSSQVAAFRVDGRELICLPQAFDLFLKHLVGGLHTVYTKLKRLDITPIVCNVEQVRILRGLGAIQPGVNRCKLISPREFDVLYEDCTNSSARPGRPPKRSALMSPVDPLEHLKRSKMNSFVDLYSHNRLFAEAKKSLGGATGVGGGSSFSAAECHASAYMSYLDLKKSSIFGSAVAAAAAANCGYHGSGYPSNGPSLVGGGVPFISPYGRVGVYPPPPHPPPAPHHQGIINFAAAMSAAAAGNFGLGLPVPGGGGSGMSGRRSDAGSHVRLSSADDVRSVTSAHRTLGMTSPSSMRTGDEVDSDRRKFDDIGRRHDVMMGHQHDDKPLNLEMNKVNNGRSTGSVGLANDDSVDVDNESASSSNNDSDNDSYNRDNRRRTSRDYRRGSSFFRHPCLTPQPLAPIDRAGSPLDHRLAGSVSAPQRSNLVDGGTSERALVLGRPSADREENEEEEEEDGDIDVSSDPENGRNILRIAKSLQQREHDLKNDEDEEENGGVRRRRHLDDDEKDEQRRRIKMTDDDSASHSSLSSSPMSPASSLSREDLEHRRQHGHGSLLPSLEEEGKQLFHIPRGAPFLETPAGILGHHQAAMASFIETAAQCSIETLLANVQAFVKLAADRNRHRENEARLEKVIMERLLKKERASRRVLQDRLDSILDQIKLHKLDVATDYADPPATIRLNNHQSPSHATTIPDGERMEVETKRDVHETISTSECDAHSK